MHFVKIQESPILIESSCDSPEHGAECLFIGKVRNNNLGKRVKGVAYDTHDKLATKLFNDLCQEVSDIYGKQLIVTIVHRKGFLNIGDVSILIRVSSPHRAESFEACRYVIEEIKKRAAIWKKEYYEDGESDWVRGHALCSHSHHSGGRKVHQNGERQSDNFN